MRHLAIVSSPDILESPSNRVLCAHPHMAALSQVKCECFPLVLGFLGRCPDWTVGWKPVHGAGEVHLRGEVGCVDATLGWHRVWC